MEYEHWIRKAMRILHHKTKDYVAKSSLLFVLYERNKSIYQGNVPQFKVNVDIICTQFLGPLRIL